MSRLRFNGGYLNYVDLPEHDKAIKFVQSWDTLAHYSCLLFAVLFFPLLLIAAALLADFDAETIRSSAFITHIIKITVIFAVVCIAGEYIISSVFAFFFGLPLIATALYIGLYWDYVSHPTNFTPILFDIIQSTLGTGLYAIIAQVYIYAFIFVIVAGILFELIKKIHSLLATPIAALYHRKLNNIHPGWAHIIELNGNGLRRTHFNQVNCLVADPALRENGTAGQQGVPYFTFNQLLTPAVVYQRMMAWLQSDSFASYEAKHPGSRERFEHRITIGAIGPQGNTAAYVGGGAAGAAAAFSNGNASTLVASGVAAAITHHAADSLANDSMNSQQEYHVVTGLPMTGGIDALGNPQGVDMFTHTSNDMNNTNTGMNHHSGYDSNF